MRNIFVFRGRGQDAETPRTGYHIACGTGRVLAVTEAFGPVELIMGYCREAFIDQWGVCCIHPFHRMSDLQCSRSWSRNDKECLMIFRPVQVHLVAEESWMQRAE